MYKKAVTYRFFCNFFVLSQTLYYQETIKEGLLQDCLALGVIFAATDSVAVLQACHFFLL